MLILDNFLVIRTPRIGVAPLKKKSQESSGRSFQCAIARATATCPVSEPWRNFTRKCARDVARRERGNLKQASKQQAAASIMGMCPDDRPHQTWDIAMGLHSRLSRPKYLIFPAPAAGNCPSYPVRGAERAQNLKSLDACNISRTRRPGAKAVHTWREKC